LNGSSVVLVAVFEETKRKEIILKQTYLKY